MRRRCFHDRRGKRKPRVSDPSSSFFWQGDSKDFKLIVRAAVESFVEKILLDCGRLLCNGQEVTKMPAKHARAVKLLVPWSLKEPKPGYLVVVAEPTCSSPRTRNLPTRTERCGTPVLAIRLGMPEDGSTPRLRPNLILSTKTSILCCLALLV